MRHCRVDCCGLRQAHQTRGSVRLCRHTGDDSHHPHLPDYQPRLAGLHAKTPPRGIPVDQTSHSADSGNLADADALVGTGGARTAGTIQPLPLRRPRCLGAVGDLRIDSDQE